MIPDVLVVDDEVDIRDLISDILKDNGFTCRLAANSEQVFKAIVAKTPNAVILDIWLQDSDLDGLGILEIIKKQYPLMPVVVISGHGTIETAVSAIKMGAYDYLEKPFTHDKLILVLKRACEAAKLKRDNIELQSKVIDRTEFIGNSAAIVKLKSEIEKIAPTTGRIMIHGAIGSGKELVARSIHKKSKRAGGPFIVFNPTAMSTSHIVTALFGEVDPVSSSTLMNKTFSLLELANGGTLYIDEVGDLPLEVQNKLLKFLQDQIIIKDNKPISLNVRLITGSNKDLQKEIANGTFRQDLYFRLKVVSLSLPTLAERKEDIPLLVKYFVKQLVKFSGLKDREFANESIALLQNYSWPHNIRQLRNAIEWTLIMNPLVHDRKDTIRPEMLPPYIMSETVSISKPDSTLDIMSMPLRKAREEFEREYLTAQMHRFNYNISRTSDAVGMERSALHRKLKNLNIHTQRKGDTESTSNESLDQ